MIIPSPLITLDYNPVNDILVVEWPDLECHSLSEVRHSLKDIIDTLKFYDVKHLLIDFRKAVIEIPREEYSEIAADFSRELSNTRLHKLARIESNNNVREAQAREIAETKISIPFKSFPTKSDALHWLGSAS